MENALLAVITAASELSSPVEAAHDVVRDFGTPEPLEEPQPVSFFPKTSLPLGRGGAAPPPPGGGASLHFNPLTAFWTEIGLSEAPFHLRRHSQDSLDGGEA